MNFTADSAATESFSELDTVYQKDSGLSVAATSLFDLTLIGHRIYQGHPSPLAPPSSTMTR